MDEPFTDIRDFKSEIQAFRIENDNLKRNYEKTTIDYELKIDHLKKEINLKTVNYDNLMNNFNELDAKYKNSCTEKIDLNQNYFDLSNEKFNIVKKYDTLESDHASLMESVSRKEKELMNSKNEVQELKNKLLTFQNNEFEAIFNKNALDMHKNDFERKEQLSLRRTKQLCDDIKALEDKLRESKQENFEEKSQHNKIIYEINLDLESKRNEIKNQKKVNEKLKEKLSFLEKVNEEKTESLRGAVESQTSIDNLLRKELNVQISISELYKEERDECLSKEKNLISAITELQESLKETYEESEKLKTEYESRLRDYSQQVSELRREINSKEKELGDANELIEKFRVKGLSEEELKSMNPATASAIGALKKGYSMTQIYSEYLQVVNERDELRVDRDRLNEYMVTILEELELKGPILKKQQDEHSNLELSVSTLAKKYDDNLSNLFTCQTELEEYRRKCDDLARKLKREEQTCTDLGNQVCCLLREVETYRGTVVRSDGKSNMNESQFVIRNRSFNQRSLMQQSHSSTSTNSLDVSGRFITAKDVITTHLVTFKNLCELQQQNIHLIEQCRELSEQQEATESLINENSLQTLAKKLESALQEADEIKVKQKKIKQLNQTIEGQKHIIQALTVFNGKPELALLIDNAAASFDRSDDSISHSTMVVSDGDKRANNQSRVNSISVLNEKLIESQEKVEKLMSEIERLRDERDKLKERHSDVVSELNRLVAESKMTNANLVAKISYNQEKSSSLEQNLINRQLEISDLQHELSESKQQLAQKSEETKAMTNELLSCQNRLKEQESELRQLQKNMKHIESLEEQISKEKAEKYQLIMSTNNLANQFSNLKAELIKPPMDHSDEEQIELKSRIKQLSLELKQEKSKYQNSLEIWQAKFSESSSKIDSLTSQLNSFNRSNSVTNLVISDPCTIGILQNTPEKREKTSDMESQLEDLTVCNYSLKKQLESFQNIMSNSESKLISNAQLIEEMEARFKDKIDEEKQKNVEMEELLENVRMAYGEIESEYKTTKITLEDQIEALNRKLTSESEIIKYLNMDITDLKAKEAQLKIDLERQRKMTKEAAENYQQELIFHAQESDTLQELEEKMNKHKKHERDLSEKLQETILLRDQYKSDLEKSESVSMEEKQVLEKEVSELRSQKETLNNRLIDLNDHVINLKKMLDPSIESGIDHSLIQRESDWNEVIQYLRLEKENAEKLKNQFEIDLHRMKTQCCQQEEKIQQLNIALEEERKFKVLEAETSKQHSEVMRKLELGQMLTESNSMLRQDRERLKEELSEKTKKLEKLTEIIEPLKAELKTKNSEIESVKLDARSLENERDLWRQRCDNLIEKSKQVNPEDFKQICMDKDRLQHQLLMEEEKCRAHLTRLEEMQNEIDNHSQSMKAIEDQLESSKKINEENVSSAQNRENVINRLKEIAKKYKAETEALKSEISEVTDQKNEKMKELESLNQELNDTRRNLMHHMNQATTSSSMNSNVADNFLREIASILQCQPVTADIIDSAVKMKRANSENRLRNQAMEGTLSKLKFDNERLKKVESNRNLLTNQEDDNLVNEDSTTEIAQPTSTWHAVPTVARVAANVHPVVQKPQNIVSGSNQISPNSQPVSACTSTARQTAEIRPIHAVPIHVTPSSTTVENADLISTAAVTTSLPANVVQALAASSVSMVIFPAVTGYSTSSGITSNSSSNTNRMKRCYEDTVGSDCRTVTMEQPSSSTEQSSIKKIRIRVPDQNIEVIQETVSQDPQSSMQQFTDIGYNVLNEIDDVCEEEIEIEADDTDNFDIDGQNETSDKRKDNSLEEINFEDADEFKNDDLSDDEEENEEENEEDYEDDVELNDEDEEDGDENDDDDDDDDDDDNPVMIDLLSSDDNDDKGNVDNSEHYNDNDNEDNAGGETSDMPTHDEGDTSANDEETRTQEYELEQAKKKIEPIVWGDHNQRQNFVSPPKLGQPIRTRNAGNFTFRRKLTSQRRSPFVGTSGRGISLSNRGMSTCRRSGGPYKPNFARR